MSLSNQNGTDSITKYYAMNQELEIDHLNNITKTFSYINSPDGLVAVIENDKINYIHTDYLNSIIAISNEQGNITNTYNYDAWGNPRNTNDWSFNNTSIPSFNRGYTGNEHLPSFGLINMNFRLYDPTIGRFISADNIIPDNKNTQNYNRYAYVINNPLKYTDPSGHFVFIPILIGAAIASASYTLSVAFQPGGFHDNWSWGDFTKSVIVGGIVGGITAGAASYLSGGATFNIASALGKAGVPFANTFSMVGVSALNSGVGMAYDGLAGRPVQDFSVSFGVGSYNFTKGELGYLGKRSNNPFEHIGYGLGMLGNMGDIANEINKFTNCQEK